MLAKHTHQNQRTWDIIAPVTAFEYNAVPHASSNQVPYLLMFGRVPSTPMEIIHVREHAPANWNSFTLPDYVDAFKEAQKRIQEVHI